MNHQSKKGFICKQNTERINFSCILLVFFKALIDLVSSL